MISADGASYVLQAGVQAEIDRIAAAQKRARAARTDRGWFPVQ
jgi:hypothetical protein